MARPVKVTLIKYSKKQRDMREREREREILNRGQSQKHMPENGAGN